MAVSRKKGESYKGKIGRTVRYELKGQMVERTIGVSRKAPSAARLPGMQVTAVITQFLKPVVDFVNIGFELETKNTLLSGYNLATSLNRLNAIKGIYPDQEIDFTRAVFSKGKMPVNNQVKVEVTDSGLRFSWDPALLLPGMKSTDQVMIVAYAPERGAAFCLLDGATRKSGNEILNFPRYKGELVLHTYVTFIASNRMSISDSLYLGSFTW